MVSGGSAGGRRSRDRRRGVGRVRLVASGSGLARGGRRVACLVRRTAHCAGGGGARRALCPRSVLRGPFWPSTGGVRWPGGLGGWLEGVYAPRAVDAPSSGSWWSLRGGGGGARGALCPHPLAAGPNRPNPAQPSRPGLSGPLPACLVAHRPGPTCPVPHRPVSGAPPIPTLPDHRRAPGDALALPDPGAPRPPPGPGWPLTAGPT